MSAKEILYDNEASRQIANGLNPLANVIKVWRSDRAGASFAARSRSRCARWPRTQASSPL